MNIKRLKELRKHKKLTLKDISKKTGYTPSYISQLERGLKQPSLEALRRISECVGVPLFVLFDDEYINTNIDINNNKENHHVIFKNNRKHYIIPEENTDYELLTPFNNEQKRNSLLTGFYVKIEPNSYFSDRMVFHDQDESIYIIKGTATIKMEDKTFELQEGDSIFIYRNTLHCFKNLGNEELILLDYMSY